MKIEHFHNACCIVTSGGGTRLLCDPWVHDGAFVGAWALAYDLHRVPRHGDDYDAIYVSHIHPDHFDEQYLGTVDRGCQVIIPRERPFSILGAKLKALGFTRVHALDDEQQVGLGDLRLTLFHPFQGQRFNPDYELDNFIDSALLIADGSHSFLNTNDNFPAPESIEHIEAKYGPPDVLSLLYNSAGYYPQCIANLTTEEKVEHRGRVLAANFAKLIEVSKVTQARYVMPFAGDYILQGSRSTLNDYLPMSTPSDAAVFLERNGVSALTLGGGGVFSIADDKFIHHGYQYTLESARAHGGSRQVAYPYEKEPAVTPAQVAPKLDRAKLRLRRTQTQFGVFPDYRVRFVGLDGAGLGELDASRDGCDEITECRMDIRLLNGILEHRYHWNSAQVGCHIDFWRSNHPSYSPELHTLLSFLHV